MRSARHVDFVGSIERGCVRTARAAAVIRIRRGSTAAADLRTAPAGRPPCDCQITSVQRSSTLAGGRPGAAAACTACSSVAFRSRISSSGSINTSGPFRTIAMSHFIIVLAAAELSALRLLEGLYVHSHLPFVHQLASTGCHMRILRAWPTAPSRLSKIFFSCSSGSMHIPT